VRILKSQTSILAEVEKQNLLFWKAIVLIGSFFAGSGILLILQEILPFDYHSYKGAVGFAALRLYAEQRELYLYLLALLMIPLITFSGYFLWFAIVTLQQKISPINLQENLKLTAFSYFIWFLVPLLFYAPYRNEEFLLSPIILISGLAFIAINLVLPFFYEDYEKKRDLLMVHVGVFLLGACPGLFLLAAPFFNALDSYSFWVVSGTGGLTWIIWQASSRFIALRMCPGSGIERSQAISVLLPRTALAFLPFAILPLETVFWAEYIQDGKAIEWYYVPYHSLILVLLAFTTFLFIWIGLLRDLRSRVFSPQQPVSDPGLRTPDPGPFLKLFFWGAFPLMMYAIFFQINIQKDLDLYHEGEKLIPAYSLLQGKTLYKEILFYHGLFAEPGITLAGFKLFGESVEGYRILEAVLHPLSVISYYYLGLLCLYYEGALLLVGLILTGLFAILANVRTLVANISLLFTICYLRSGKIYHLFLVAFTAFLSFLASTDTGLTVILAQSALWVFIGLKKHGAWSEFQTSGSMLLQGWKSGLAYTAFLIISFIPFLGYLIKIDAARPFLFTYVEMFQSFDHWSSLPFKPFILGMQDHYDFWESYLLPLLLLLTITFLRFKAYSLKWRSEDWILVLFLLVNIIYFKRALDRSDAGHASLGSHFGWILLLLLLTEAIRARKRYALIYLLLIPLLFIPTLTLREGKTTLVAQFDTFSRKNSIDVTGRVRVFESRLGRLFLSQEQAHTIMQMLQFFTEKTRPGDYIWDFTNHGAFYFLTDRLNPTRYPQVAYVVTEENQREVIRDFQLHPPRFVIFRSQTHLDEMDTVDNYLRHYLLSDYLLHHYKPFIQINNFTLLEPGAIQAVEEPYQKLLFHAVDFGYVPFLWGKERYEEILSKARILREWRFSNNVLIPGSQISGTREVEASPRSIPLSRGIELSEMNIDPKSAAYVVINIKADEGKSGQLLWASDQIGFSSQNGLLFSLRDDNAFHPYIFRLSSLPGWVWVNKITGLRLNLKDASGSIVVESIKWVEEL
jgi:hypothetical protein